MGLDDDKAMMLVDYCVANNKGFTYNYSNWCPHCSCEPTGTQYVVNCFAENLLRINDAKRSHVYAKNCEPIGIFSIGEDSRKYSVRRPWSIRNNLSNRQIKYKTHGKADSKQSLFTLIEEIIDNVIPYNIETFDFNNYIDFRNVEERRTT